MNFSYNDDDFSTPIDYDRTHTNDDDGQVFYGYDDSDSGTTDWYTKENTLDSTTPTPSDDDDW